VIRKLSFSIEIAFALFIISAATGLLWIPLRHANSAMLMVLISLPAIASLGLVLAAMLTQISSIGRFAFPLNLTFPLVHVALLFLAVKLVLTTPMAVEQVRSEWQIATEWMNWRLLMAAFLLEVSGLSLGLALSSRKRRVGTI